MKMLSELLNMLPASLNIPDVTVSGVKLDSRQVANGDLFIAIPGYETDGRAYIDAAIDQGAVAVIAESPGLAVEQRRGVQRHRGGRWPVEPRRHLHLPLGALEVDEHGPTALITAEEAGRERQYDADQ